MRSLHVVESQLSRIKWHHGRQIVRSWEQHSPLLARAGLEVPREVPEWVRGLDRLQADIAVRDLIRLAQRGDEVAVLAVLVFLRPGLLSIARRYRAPVEEVVAEAAIVVLEFPLDRRRKVIAGLLLDVRHRFWAQSKRPESPVREGREILEEVPAPGELGVTTTSAEQLFDLVCGAWRTGVLTTIAARLVVETRILGEPIPVAARRLGMKPHAALVRRHRAEARLAQVAAALGRSCEQHQTEVVAVRATSDIRRGSRLTAPQTTEQCTARNPRS